MATSPEGGGFFRNIIDQIKVALHLQERQQLVQQAQKQGRKSRRSEEREEKKEKAHLIIEELKNVTPSHKAYEILKGVKFDEIILRRDPKLADELLGILKTADINDYHDANWLQQKKVDLSSHALATNAPPEQEAFTKLEDNLNKMIAKIDEHKRRIELDEAKRIDDLLPEEEADRERKRKGIKMADVEKARSNEIDWRNTVDEIVSDIPITDDNRVEMDAYTKAINNIKQGTFGDKREGDQLPEAERFFEHQKKEAIKEMGKAVGNPELMQRTKDKYEKINKTYEKYARFVVEKNPSLRGRFTNIMYGPEGRAVEEMIKKDANFRDYWFYQILSPVLQNKQTEPHRELYNLYTAGDMDSFLEIIRRIKDDKGNNIGGQIASRYEILKNTIFQSHDMDFYARHPSLDIKEFIGNTSLFLNDYIDAASQDPMVAMSKRAYEYAMLQIRETNNGYIPREWLAWQEGKMRASKLDEMAEDYLKQWINAGQLYQIKMDEFSGGFLPSPSIWGRKQINNMSAPITMRELYGYESDLSEEYRKELGDLRISSALKQAKGLALVDMRLLEIIAQSKGTGSKGQDYTYYSADKEQPFDLAAKQFNSVPYEGIVRHLEPIIHYYTRFSVGGEYYDSFFNMVVTQWPDWKPEHMKKIVELAMIKHDHKKAVKYIDSLNLPKEATQVLRTRLLENDNPFDFSGMWGPSTKWRIGDASIGFDDWERDQAYGTNIKLMLADKWAERQATRLYTQDYEKKLRAEYRQRAKESNNIHHRQAAENDERKQGLNPKDFDDEFESHWQKVGKYMKADDGEQYNKKIDKLWDDKAKTKEVKQFLLKLKKAYKARTWLQAAARHPLLVAREISVSVHKDRQYKQERPLRHYIIQKLLQIDIDEVAAQRTPKEWEEAGFDRIAEVEGALAGVEQAAIRNNRDLKKEDFEDIIKTFKDSKDPQVNRNVRTYQLAKDYWEEVQKALLPNESTNIKDMYDALGIDDAPTLKNGNEKMQQGTRHHTIHSEKINQLFDIKKNEFGHDEVVMKEAFETEILNNDILDRNYNHLFSTEDMGWEYLNIAALGSRNPVRRAGDLASHVQFGQLFEQYLSNEIIARPDIKDLIKAQKEMWVAMNGDSVEQAYNAGFHIAYATGMMWKKEDLAWKIPVFSNVYELTKATSIMQEIRGRDRADSWGPNEMLHYCQAVGGQQILPKKALQGLEGMIEAEGGNKDGPFKNWTTGGLSKMLGGTKARSVWEIGNAVLLFSTIAMSIAAFQKAGKDDEED